MRFRRSSIWAKPTAMSISVQPSLEARLREKAEAEGISVEQYLEGLLGSQEQAEEELERLALEGLDSGEPIAVDESYWQEKHSRLDERFNKTTR